ncbi:heterokaryon incompatibility protein-domain-containing protein [Sordaria sp. MPI-SDFR-AT-0083]|nr:heterokaryon incompatibility protein-domain-containing protein [Sordaria sp. MPI-SDFR-AT-0083]
MVTSVEPPLSNTLCRKCQQSFPSTGPWPFENPNGYTYKLMYNWKEWFIRKSTIEELDTSITAESCHLCRVLLNSLLPKSILMSNYDGYSSWREQHKNDQYRLLYVANDSVPNGHCLEIKTNGFQFSMKVPFKRVSPGHALQGDKEASPDQVWTMQAGSLLFADDSSVLPSPVVIHQPSSSTTFDPLVLTQVRRWVDECIREHEACIMSAASNRLIMSESQTMVRFIDIGLDESATIHLVEEIQEKKAKYITLSHRWTTHTSSMTLKGSNKAAYYTTIPTENWPKIYKDVVFLSRFLGIRYIWIDSLCIIQDDLQDWSEQASLMHHIYAHGYINLAGTCGESSPGLEVTRNPASISPCIVSRLRPNNLQEYWACYVGDSPVMKLKHAPLYSRGWCYQERFLSTRTVHFNQQLYWECKTRQASETFGWSTKSEHPDVITTVGQGVEPNPLKSVLQGNAMAYSALWEKIIADYSETEFTNYSDRLVALRGIFNNFWGIFDGSKENDWCVAGLWRRCMTRQLLWEHRHQTDHIRTGLDSDRIAKYYMRMEKELASFPSWSWASCPTSARSSSIQFPAPYHSEYTPNQYNEDLVEIESIIPLNQRAFDQGYPAFESASIITRTSFNGPNFEVDKLFKGWELWKPPPRIDWITLEIVKRRKALLDLKHWKPSPAPNQWKPPSNLQYWNSDSDLESWRSPSIYRIWGPNNTSKDELHARIQLDRPILRTTQPKNVQLLPILVQCESSHFNWVRIEGILVESVGMRDNMPAFRRMGKWQSSHHADKDQIPIPGLPEYFDSKENLDLAMAAFIKRRESLPKRRFMLV